MRASSVVACPGELAEPRPEPNTRAKRGVPTESAQTALNWRVVSFARGVPVHAHGVPSTSSRPRVSR